MRKEIKEFKTLIRNLPFNNAERFDLRIPIFIKKNTKLIHHTSCGTSTRYIYRDCHIVAIDVYGDFLLDKPACSKSPSKQDLGDQGYQNYCAIALPMNILQKLNKQLTTN